MKDSNGMRRQDTWKEQEIKSLPSVYGSDWDKTIEQEMKTDPDLPHIFVRKYSDLRRGRKKRK